MRKTGRAAKTPKPGKLKMATIRAELDALAKEAGFLGWSDLGLCARRRRVKLPKCPPGWEQERPKPRVAKVDK